MKKITSIILALALLCTLAACGGEKAPAGNNGGTTTPRDTRGNDTPDTPDTPDVPDAPPANNGGGGYLNIMDEPLTVAPLSISIEEAVGKSIEGERIVRKLTEEGFKYGWRPDGVIEHYTVYEFDKETGEVTDGQYWYRFDNFDNFDKAFREMLGSTWENNVRGYNTNDLFYGYYQIPAISNYDNDEEDKRTWNDAVLQGEYESTDTHELIQ